MTARRWQPTEPFEVDGMVWRVRAGRKGPDDLVLEWCVRGRFRPVPMSAGALMANFFFDNEDALFPPEFAEGGERYMRALREAVEEGWRPVAARLAADREARRAQQKRDLDDQGWFR